MSIEWIGVGERVPDDRRKVLVWGDLVLPPMGSRFLGVSRFNRARDGGLWDRESSSLFTVTRVTHWAEITPPAPGQVSPPPRKP